MKFHPPRLLAVSALGFIAVTGLLQAEDEVAFETTAQTGTAGDSSILSSNPGSLLEHLHELLKETEPASSRVSGADPTAGGSSASQTAKPSPLRTGQLQTGSLQGASLPLSLPDVAPTLHPIEEYAPTMHEKAVYDRAIHERYEFFRNQAR